METLALCAICVLGGVVVGYFMPRLDRLDSEVLSELNAAEAQLGELRQRAEQAEQQLAARVAADLHLSKQPVETP